MDILAHLRETRLLLTEKTPAGHAATIYRQAAIGVLEGLGLSLEIVDTYTAQRNSQCLVRDDRVILVIDQALVEHFHLLNGLLRSEAAPAIVEGAFNRVIAEECYSAGELPCAAVFLGRALACKAFLRHALAKGMHGLDTFWQILTIIGHECGHAVPAGTELADAMRMGAKLAISAEVTAIGGRLNASIRQMLEGEAAPARLTLEEELIRDFEAGGGQADSTLLRVGSDEHFVAEVACDGFSTSVVSSHIRHTMSGPTVDADVLRQILVATYTTFLNMRLHQYVSDVVRAALHRPLEADEDELLRGGYVLALRGRLARQSIESVWDDLAPEGIQAAGRREGFVQVLQETGDAHNRLLLLPVRKLLAETLHNNGFRNGIDHHLEEWGFDAQEFRIKPWDARQAVERFWALVAA